MGTEFEESVKSGLSKREALALTRLAAEGKTVITISDIEEALDISYSAAKKTAANLVDKKWLDRLKSGTYLIVPLEAGEEGEYTEHEYVIASHLAESMYISYWTALNHHGFTEQVPLTVYAATTDRVPTREIHNVEYRFITVTEDKFFGFQEEAVGSHRVNIASPEKTLVDCADHPEYCGGITELAKAFQKPDLFDKDELTNYLLKTGNGAAIKRIVYLADLHSVDLPRRSELEDGFTKGYSKLDPTREADGGYSREYRLKINVPSKELEGDRY